MAQITTKITIDVGALNTINAIVAKQYDKSSRYLNIQLQNDGEDISIGSDSTVIISARRADDTSKSYSGVVEGDGTVTVPLTYWMLELDDTVECDVSILTDNGETELSSLSFEVDVQASADDFEEVSTDDQYSLLQELLNKVNPVIDILDEAKGYAESANNSMLSARGYVSSASGYSNTARVHSNNASYSASAAASDAANASSYATLAASYADSVKDMGTKLDGIKDHASEDLVQNASTNDSDKAVSAAALYAQNQSLTAAISTLNDSLSDYVVVRSFVSASGEHPGGQLTETTYTTPTGYTALSVINTVTNGWVDGCYSYLFGSNTIHSWCYHGGNGTFTVHILFVKNL